MSNLSSIFFDFTRRLADSFRHDHAIPPSTSSTVPRSELRDTEMHQIEMDTSFPTTPPSVLYTPAALAETHAGSLRGPIHPPSSRSAPTQPSETLEFDPSWSDSSIRPTVPPPAYTSEGRPPHYSSYSENNGAPAWPGSNGRIAIVELPPAQRLRIERPIEGTHASSDPSQNPPHLPFPAATRGRNMHRGSLFARIVPRKRNLWLPAIVIGALVGVYLLVKTRRGNDDPN